MKEINYKDMKFNPFNLIGDEWMLVTAGDEQSGCNTMTASWGHLGCLWGHNDPSAVIYLRPSRYTKEFVDKEDYFSLCVMDKSFKKQMARGQDWQGRSYARLYRQYRLFRGSQAGTGLQETLSVGITGERFPLSGHYRCELSPA